MAKTHRSFDYFCIIGCRPCLCPFLLIVAPRLAAGEEKFAATRLHGARYAPGATLGTCAPN